MEFTKVKLKNNLFYWTWKDLPFLPYAWLDKKDLKNLPKPFYLPEIHPGCTVGWKSDDKDDYTNIIKLPKSFEEIKMDSDLRKDLRRVEKKNVDLKLVWNEPNALENSKKWFLELWKENKKDFARRLELWKERCHTISAYLNGELIAVHIGMKEKDIIYYFGCWWNRKYKGMSVPTFLLKIGIEDAIKNGMKYYDLEIGNQPYKKQWGVIEKPTKYYAVVTKKIAKELGLKKFIELK